MTERVNVACIQLNSGNALEANLHAASELVRVARDGGAQLVLLPENVAMMEWGRDAVLAKAMPEASHVALEIFRALAAELHLWLHCGTLAVRERDGMLANRSYLVRPDGAIAASYDKIHMFDADLGDGGRYRESSTFLPGDKAVVADTPWGGGLGLSICYDVRFPHLYRALAHGGASFMAVPAAFARATGEAHWHVLLRARAIENGCYVFAPAQTGVHANHRETYGHALIIDPWGTVLADAGEAPGVIWAEIDPACVHQVREKLPSLRHDRPFALP